MTLQIRGKDYSVQVEAISQHNEKGVTYWLTGRRGAKYYTVRNRVDLTKMFIVPENFLRGFKTLDGVWLTDEGGELKIIKQ